MTGSVKYFLSLSVVGADYESSGRQQRPGSWSWGGVAGVVGGCRWEEWGGKQTLSQAINQRHSYCGTIIQSSLLHNSAQGSSGLAASFQPLTPPTPPTKLDGQESERKVDLRGTEVFMCVRQRRVKVKVSSSPEALRFCFLPRSLSPRHVYTFFFFFWSICHRWNNMGVDC